MNCLKNNEVQYFRISLKGVKFLSPLLFLNIKTEESQSKIKQTYNNE